MTETAVAAPVETRDTKLEIIMGREALDKLADATVLVLGCGGVGSNCCEALARGGIGHFAHRLGLIGVEPAAKGRKDGRLGVHPRQTPSKTCAVGPVIQTPSSRQSIS